MHPGCVLVEAKAVEKILQIHKAQLLSYMKLLDVPIGLLINFHEMKVTDGISRLILPGANLRKQQKQNRSKQRKRDWINRFSVLSVSSCSTPGRGVVQPGQSFGFAHGRLA